MLRKIHLLQVVFFLAQLRSCAADELTVPYTNLSLVPTSSARVVVTFDTMVARENAHVPPNVTLVKQYGRRLVVLLNHDYDAVAEREWLMRTFNASDVEHDSLVLPDSLQDNEHLLQTLGQWNILEEEPFSIHPDLLWNLTQGKVTQVIGVLDGGLPDISLPLFQHIVPGFDFISDETYSMDGDGRDAIFTDPGDASPECPTNSWHGLQVTSVLAATPTEALPFKGVCSECSVLPVRVLGKCKTGYTSDVADALVWAVGGEITGVQAPQSSAGIITMSFTGLGSCPSYLQSAITQAVNAGAILVAAAGNNAGDSTQYYPGNCYGVVTVTATNRYGEIASYANTGLNVALGAPGGDSENPLLAISLDLNTAELNVIRTMGTSFSVPQVAGVWALLQTMNVVTSTLQISYLTRYYEILTAVKCLNKCGIGILDARRAPFIAGTEDSVTIPMITVPSAGDDNGLVNGAVACSVGTYSSDGQTTTGCIPCPAGTYSVTVGASSSSTCVQCPPNSNTSAGASVCQPNAGFVGPTILYPFLTGLGNTGSGRATTTVVGQPVIQTNVCDSVSKCRAAAYFSNTNTASPSQYLTVPNTYNTPMTIMLWARMDTGYPGGCTVSMDDGTSAIGTTPTNQGFVVAEAPGVQYMYARLGTWQPAGNTYNPAANTWHHIAYTINDKTVTSYYNGGSAGSTTGTAALPGYLKLLVGTCNNNPGISYGFKGHISDVRMYNMVLTSTQVQSVYNSGNSPAPYLACSSSCSAGQTTHCNSAGTAVCCAPGTYFADGGAGSTCTSCPAGTYAATGAGQSASACTPCAAGYYSAGSGASSCTPCAAGYIAASGASICTQCSAGTYSAGGSTCTPCAAGYYSAGSGASSCTPCAAGYVAASGASSCTQCSAGTYSAGGSTCTPCAAGYIAASGVSICTQCSAGTYSAGGSTCIPCAAGYVAASGASICTQCSAGTYSAGGGSTCAPCSAGYISASGVSSCTQCSAGTYSAGAITCTPCAAGYISTSGASSCTQCSAGTYSAGGGSTCTPCSAGNYSATSGASSCTPCAAGNGSASGASSCAPCSAGTFSAGGTPCTPCSAGSYSPLPGADVCTQCPGTLVSAAGTSAEEGCTCPADSLRFSDYECVCNDGFLPVNSATVPGLYSCVTCDFSKIVSFSSLIVIVSMRMSSPPHVKNASKKLPHLSCIYVDTQRPPAHDTRETVKRSIPVAREPCAVFDAPRARSPFRHCISPPVGDLHRPPHGCQL